MVVISLLICLWMLFFFQLVVFRKLECIWLREREEVELKVFAAGGRTCHLWQVFLLCFLVAHQLEGVDLFELGDDELSPHV